MKTIKLTIVSGLLIFGLSSTAVAGDNNKTTDDAKAKVEAPAVIQDDPLYWYRVSFDNPAYTDGYIAAGATLVAYAVKTAVTSPCDPGSIRHCLRGFNSPQTAETGDNGTDQITTDEQP